MRTHIIALIILTFCIADNSNSVMDIDNDYLEWLKHEYLQYLRAIGRTRLQEKKTCDNKRCAEFVGTSFNITKYGKTEATIYPLKQELQFDVKINGELKVREFKIKKLFFSAKGNIEANFEDCTIRSVIGVNDQKNTSSAHEFEVKDIDLFIDEEKFVLKVDGNLITRIYKKIFMKSMK